MTAPPPAGPESASRPQRDEVLRRLASLVAMVGDGASVAEVRGAQFDCGLAWVWFPEGRGGLGAAVELQELVDETLAGAGIGAYAETSGIGVAMSAPTLVAFGTPEQQDRFLRRIFTGEDVWCQLFSEPGSGSDLAGLATRAVRDGDDWILDGQKVWTSYGGIADWGLVLARHDPELPKHQGLTYFALDMHSPGVETRPLREMTGQGQFFEVFLTGVRVADSMRVGDIGEGWRASMSTLADERAGRGDPLGADAIGHALRAWRASGCTHPGRRDRLVDLWIRHETIRLTNERGAQTRAVGGAGPEGSIVKLAAAELAQEIYAFTLDLMGPAGQLMPEGYDGSVIERGASHLADRTTEWSFLRSRGYTLEGGTAQIQRNVMAERLLGLPGEPNEHRGLPWSRIPRS